MIIVLFKHALYNPLFSNELNSQYISCRQLNPPASEALKLMHMLAADPGIVAIMNKVQYSTLY